MSVDLVMNLTTCTRGAHTDPQHYYIKPKTIIIILIVKILKNDRNSTSSSYRRIRSLDWISPGSGKKRQ